MGKSTGFTLIELLVALSISTVLITGVYSVVREGGAQMAVVEAHEGDLYSFFLLRRMLERDLSALIELEDEESKKNFRFQVTTEGVVLNCRGEVVAESRLGGIVQVHYRWQTDGQGALLERVVVPLGGDIESSDEVLRLGRGLEGGSVELYQDQEWGPADQLDEEKLRGLRIYLDFEQIGRWSLVYPVLPLSSMSGTGTAG